MRGCQFFGIERAVDVGRGQRVVGKTLGRLAARVEVVGIAPVGDAERPGEHAQHGAVTPHVFAPQAQNTWGASVMKVVDIRIERTDPSVFGAYRPQSWEETGDYNADKLPYQRG